MLQDSPAPGSRKLLLRTKGACVIKERSGGENTRNKFKVVRQLQTKTNVLYTQIWILGKMLGINSVLHYLYVEDSYVTSQSVYVYSSVHFGANSYF